ncbi:MAG: hypothetical protein K2H60_13610 [Muribaculaceae bacterium]|nr:hypothetical protein [Muribaculaceae bacterium]
MEVSAEIIKEMGCLVHNEAAMTKLLKYVRRLSRQITLDKEKSDLSRALEESLHEVKLHQEGKIKLKSWDEFINE